jgi:hypothetical protein
MRTRCNPSTQETEAGGSQIQGRHGLHINTLSKKQQQQHNKMGNERPIQSLVGAGVHL